MEVFMRAFLLFSGAFGGKAATPPKTTAARDMRFDAIRGLLLISMAAVHVPTLVSHFLHEPLGFMSDAEGFIFLSASMAGLAYGKTYRQTDWSAMSRRVWQRARQIYFIHLAVILPVVLTAWAFAAQTTPLANHFHDFLVHPWGSLALIPLLLHQPPLFDILPLYIILLGVTPLLLALARRRGWGIVLAVSASAGSPRNSNWTRASSATRRDCSPYAGVRLIYWHGNWSGSAAWPLENPHCDDRFSPANGGLVWRQSQSPLRWWVFWLGMDFCHSIPIHFLWIDKWTLGPLRMLNFARWVAFLLAWNPRVPERLLAPVSTFGTAFIGRVCVPFAIGYYRLDHCSNYFHCQTSGKSGSAFR